MNQPLGYAVGNYLEVREAVRFLAGNEQNPRLYRIVVELCKHMYKLSDMYTEMSDDEVEEIIKDAISSGKAYKKFKEFISGQGGDVSFVESLESAVDVDNISYEYRASKTGVISSVDAQLIGRASLALGAGRVNKESEIDLYAGIIFNKVVGDFVNEGDVIATLYAASSDKLEAAKALIEESVSVSDSFSDSDIIIDVL